MSEDKGLNGPNYWLVVGSYENYLISKERGFTVQGLKSRQRKKAHLVKPNDKMLYYLTGRMEIASVVTVKSETYEDHTRIWPCSSSADEVYPWRFTIEPDLIVDEDRFVSAREIYAELEYLKKWPAKNWTLGFQGNVHQWPEHDYQIVRTLLEGAQ